MKFLLHVVATAYCLGGHTASGTGVAAGTVAVDPRVIPIGAVMLIPGYGAGRALDTGSAIQGARIDVWFASCGRARRWGARRLTVRVSS